MRSYGMGVAAGGFNNDGRVDLDLARLGPNVMLRNNGDGTFSDVTSQTGTGDPSCSVSASLVDYERDGWLDLYVEIWWATGGTGSACGSPGASRHAT